MHFPSATNHRLALSAMATLALGTAPASADDITVNPGGSIQAAIDAALADPLIDTVIVMPGTYDESLLVAGAPIPEIVPDILPILPELTLEAGAGGQVLVQAEGTALSVSGLLDVTVDGIDFNGAPAVTCFEGLLELDGCVVTGVAPASPTPQPQAPPALAGTGTLDLNLKRSTFIGQDGIPEQPQGGSSLAVGDCELVRAVECIFQGGDGLSAPSQSGEGGHGIEIFQSLVGIASSEMTGGAGGAGADMGSSVEAGRLGGSGVVAASASVGIVDSSLRGGSGGNGIFSPAATPNTSDGGAGRHGLEAGVCLIAMGRSTLTGGAGGDGGMSGSPPPGGGSTGGAAGHGVIALDTRFCVVSNELIAGAPGAGETDPGAPGFDLLLLGNSTWTFPPTALVNALIAAEELGMVDASFADANMDGVIDVADVVTLQLQFTGCLGPIPPQFLEFLDFLL